MGMVIMFKQGALGFDTSKRISERTIFSEKSKVIHCAPVLGHSKSVYGVQRITLNKGPGVVAQWLAS